MPAGQCVGKRPVPLDINVETRRLGRDLESVPAIIAVVRIPLPTPLGVSEHCTLHLRLKKQRFRKKLNIERRYR
jgi:hypothetical protein